MRAPINPWNKIGQLFVTKTKEERANSVAIDNIEIAWPVILRLIDSRLPQKKRLRVLDHGCGTGAFADKLYSLGFDVVALDTAKSMISAAKSSRDSRIEFIAGNIVSIKGKRRFDLITSIMTLQFVESLKETVQVMAEMIKRGGLVILAVFNPEFVADFLSVDVIFKDFDSEENPTKGMMCLSKNICIPTFVRTAEQYDKAFLEQGMKKIFEQYPCFTKEFFNSHSIFVNNFLGRYPKKNPEDICEFLILAYSKT
jgi:2-polyprenyl-3-methyl-5-hydroxy-6-metoxy-1,4-benzoquinol methylase